MIGGDPITTQQVVFILFIAGALFAAWWRVERAITSSRNEMAADIATVKSDMATAVASVKSDMASAIAAVKSESSQSSNAAAALAALIQVQLAEHKLHCAETYITKQGMRETRDEIMSGIKGLGERQEAMNQRMDNIVGSMLPQVTARPAV